MRTIEWNSSFTDGLIHYWGFNEGKGSKVADIYNGKNNASFYGTPTWVSESLNSYALNISSGNYLFTDRVDDLPVGTEPYTLSLWLKPSSPSGNVTFFWTSETENYLFWWDALPDIVYQYRGAFGEPCSFSPSEIINGDWNHIVFNCDSESTNCYVYVNGVQKIVGNTGGNMGGNITIGNGPSGMTSGSVLFDEIGLWNRQLSEGEISSLYNLRKGLFYIPVDTAPPSVYVNPDYSEKDSESHYFGYDAFNNITAGIDAVASGGIVNIATGTYDEQLYINKTITLQGAGDTTIIQPSNISKLIKNDGYARSVIFVNDTGGEVTIKNLKINGGYLSVPLTAPARIAEIYFLKTGGVIENLTAVELHNLSSYASLVNETYSIMINSANIFVNMEIKNNFLSTFCHAAIEVGSSSEVNNTINASIHDNTIIGEGLVNYLQNGIESASVLNVDIYNNQIINLAETTGNQSAGILMNSLNRSSDLLVIRNNTINNTQSGIKFLGVQNLTIEGNLLDTMQNGIISINSSGLIIIANNTILANETGILIQSQNTDIITQVYNNSINLKNNANSAGYNLSYCSNSSFYFSENTLADADYGFYIYSGDNLNISIYNNSVISRIYNVFADNFSAGINAANNWWGSQFNKVIRSNLSGNISFIPYYTNQEKTILGIAPDANNSVTITDTASRVVISNLTENVTILIEKGVTNATIDVSYFINNGTGAIPQMIISSNMTNITIPSANITSANLSWEGIISAPTITAITLPADTGTLITAIEIGSEAELSLDKAVRILFPDKRGKRVGYSRIGLNFTEITSVCEEDSQISSDALDENGDCKIDAGNDLVIWTKHFTAFGIFDSSVGSSNSKGSSSICTYQASYNWNCSAWGECANGKQIRTCKEKNNCGNVYGRPETERSCNVPSQLFDIKLILEDYEVKNSNELTSIITFISFGNISTFVNLTYTISDSSEKRVYSEEENITVTTDQTIRKNFKKLNLSAGKYTLVLTTIYGENVTDEFRQEFSVKGEENEFFQIFNEDYLSLIAGVIAVMLIIILLIRKHQEKN